MATLPGENELPARQKTAVLLVNLGSPQAPTPPAVRRYLREFLSDPRVVELPRAVWLPILHGIVLTLRPRVSAQKYASIWSHDGSPLIVHSSKQATLLERAIAARLQAPVHVAVAMRYGQPAIADVLARLQSSGFHRILLLPLYPQYSASTTATVIDETGRYLQRTRDLPELRIVKDFHSHPAYIGALSATVSQHWAEHGRPEKLLMSFHGLPRAMIERGDPYFDQCQRTAKLLAEALALKKDQWQVAFQSRFGRAQWLTPSSAETLAQWGREALPRVDVLCPGFVADCLETLEEIGIEGKRTFLSSGGGQFHLIECLNENGAWIDALATIAAEHLSGWAS